ncbi:NACHT domain-containing protein [Mesorhizobium amorphae]|uniref:NACHT domain-containing protein n=1 Tax=Mesorhizobium amorphae TaxID=71433 RepID=UPI001783D156|nr:NACHT domain-containing protein [Mesorhizobium amorphae]
MANPTIKSTAIVRAGYEFQDLVGIETLIRFYREPHLFDWVMLEADADAYGSLDDVIAARSDGTFEFTQVKFTVDAEKYYLDWDWLLAKKPNGTSMISKWAKSLSRVRTLGPVRSCSLRTNRIPSDSFKAALDGLRIDPTRLDLPVKARFEEECGGAGEAAAFLNAFEFRSLSESLDSLEARIRLELVPSDLLPGGWSFFRDQVRRWAIRRDEPPGGRILHKHLAQIITRQRAEPIRQDFLVPPAYTLPSDQFHQHFLARIADPKTPTTILWGTPGRGKSTYLSYLTGELRNNGKPVIRHHYFLSGDDTADRISYSEISHSLTNQLIDRYPESVPDQIEDADKLQSTLASVARHFEEQGERLYVIIDGLDHVWRDYQKVDQLNYLFSQLIPLPANVSLIVGTQRVPRGQLPSRLLANTSGSDWVAIPPMDTLAVHHWVDAQDKAGRLIIRGEPDGKERGDSVVAISKAFYEISHGHPLHLIYAFETLARTGASVDAEQVALLPPCPEGDIQNYYANLWDKLSATGREILHALSGSEFNWPGLGIRQCLGNYEEIGFLLEARSSGMLPFHGSILAYVRERSDHVESFQSLLPRIIAWLEVDAPAYWRWGWLWLSKAKLGDFAPLMAGVSREWAVSSLAHGWPERQIIRIFSEAEEYAFRQLDLPVAVALRSIKTRVMNARDFQIQDYSLFEEAAIRSSNNEQQLKSMFDDLAALSEAEVAMLPRAASPDLSEEIVEGCELELERRIDVWLELRHRPDGEFRTLARRYLDLVALSSAPRITRVWNFLQRFREPAEEIRYFGERLMASNRYDALLELRAKLADPRWIAERAEIDDQILRVACALGANPFTRINFEGGELSPLYASWCGLHKHIVANRVRHPPVPTNLVRDRYGYGIDTTLVGFIEVLFFAALAHSLRGTSAEPFQYPALPREGLGWLGEAFDLVVRIADEVGTRQLPADLSAPFVGAEHIIPVFHGRAGATENDQAQYRSFAAALRRIAFDLHLIGRTAGTTLVGIHVLAKARTSAHWSDELWLEKVADLGRPTMTAEAALEMMASDAIKVGATVSVFNERSGGWALRARVAAIHGLSEASTFAHRAADCLLGYGYRKDPWIFDVLGAVEVVHDPTASPALAWISTLVPIVDQITEFTDGSGTNHARSEIIRVTARTYPDRLPIFFQRHVEEEEWSYADECLRQVGSVLSLDTPEIAALLSTFLDPRVLGTLEQRAKGDVKAKELLDDQIRFLGGKPTDHSDHYRSGDTQLPEEKPIVGARGPNEFDAVVADTTGSYDHHNRKSYFEKWLGIHKEAGKGKEALESVRKYFRAKRETYGANDVLDAAVEVSMEVEGREAAYEWLVKAHIERLGWQSNWTSRDEVMARLHFSAENYPERWKQYIVDTSEPPEFYRTRGYGLTIGAKYLVEFLLLVGQRDLATRIVDAMVKTIVDEVHDLQIPEATWFR